MRINQAEINAAMENDLPVVTGVHADTPDSAVKKIETLNQQLDTWEKQLLGGGNHASDNSADTIEVNGQTLTLGADGKYYLK